MATFEGDTDVPGFEDVDEECVVSSEPYLYEPECTSLGWPRTVLIKCKKM